MGPKRPSRQDGGDRGLDASGSGICCRPEWRRGDCGSALAQGQFVANFYSGEAGVLGMRRIIDVWRVREAIIIPLASRSLQDAGRWLALYDDEGLWLDWALERVGLPPAKDVTSFQPINPPIG
jgi:hypothetical protein